MNSSDAYRLSEEVFIEPIGEKFIIYVPTRKIAVLADKHLADAFKKLREGLFSIDEDPDGLMSELLNTLGLHQAQQESNAKHITKFQGAPKPKSVTLFLTTTW